MVQPQTYSLRSCAKILGDLCLSHDIAYRKAMRAIATGFDTGEWPAPITADYTDELNDFDLRRLEALRTQA